ncbi:hypothetical protein L596_017463 [Steinernema carpocapsae]|uniref:Uncharacterized protein n=1 Tax=Steinernema carpocapsae TaxID=34508 RepID=A0A4U5N242_STECR|nr:hypothetical protein L596_017463 [Steinernema carpocapsae]
MGNVWALAQYTGAGKASGLDYMGASAPLWKNRFAPLGGFAHHSCLKLYVASHSYDRRLRRLFPPSAASPLRSSEERSASGLRISFYYHKTKVALRPSSVASPPRFCHTSQLCAALHSYDRRLRRLFPPSAASQLRKRGSALRAFGSRSYYHKKSRFAPLLGGFATSLCQHLTALRCFAQLRSAAPPPLPTFGGFAAPQERLGPPGLRISVPTHKTKSLCAPRWLRHLTLAFKALRCLDGE